ncbi:Hypothetical protein EMIHUDRAFT_224178 [Emiliania huxleyi CCMP1516]|uniref:EGF-like domain-containing protein n=2 Tax=Emiliania huxleyi TaxID=2903 RepID=A0A0D3KSN5_EMIH1|nr:hypothetical protein EMIHUDRAFT_251777 [Emiliania huxleyi CCMP1516]XP_005791199.1 Hypothetical protein EMIHUDRAFT_224178 [Emiliania huxleyi CCMP1516]EOD38527.1 hypothetical protein EMIHUDRAFT_251777 [Emiliania huxleyi CCMP1516]EOD38770.1 Hypothetical protein EMIHUDRAFT_224178 [Emiliania huxleyi CCMP1516]|eukprot:XP_005790956.1 hypothetical protein EMIHUDRAFT_251777 [Emiliania huxleyi CCMP1516]
MVKRLRIHHRLNVTVVAQDTRGCGVHGTCDEWRSRCDCPIGFTGEACQIATLPACQLGNHLLPIRSWILLALFRLHRGGKAKEVSDRGIGPDLASFEPHCVHLPPSLSLKNFLTVPAVFTNLACA